MSEIDPVLLRHRALEQIAMAALQAARVSMESGARAYVVHKCAAKVAQGLGAETVAFRTGYASISITVTSGMNSITRMLEVGRHGVNHRQDQAMRRLAVRVAAGGMTPEQTQREIDELCRRTHHYPAWVVAVAVGLACAAFGRLLGIDWAGFLATAVAATVGQYARHLLISRHINGFAVAAIIAFLSAGLGALGALGLGSATVSLVQMASVLLLVPGVPALNAQMDIMEGSPTLGSARLVTVIVVMIFATIGVWGAQNMLRFIS